MAATITVVCPHCKNRMRASVQHIGRKGRCPTCKNLVEIAPSAGESLATIEPATAALLRRGRRRGAGSTEVNSWLAGLIAVAATIFLYLGVFWPLGHAPIEQHVSDLFLKRGPIPFVITLLTCWGFAILVLKYVAVRRQISYAELELELIPLEIGLQITPANVDQFLHHLGRLAPEQQQSILGRRIQGALEHFKSRNSVPEVQQYLASEAELEASGVDSGYMLLRAFIWAVPILGFIGTVMGIGQAVGKLEKSFSKPAQAAANADANASPGSARSENAPGREAGNGLMSGMKDVIKGLHTAFDTTFVALIMAVLLLFPTESLRKSEYAMLDRIEEFANESLLRRMAEKRGELSDEMPTIVRNALESAFQEHQRWLAQWQAQVAQLGQVIGADFESAAVEVQEKLARNHAQGLAEVRNASRAVQELFQTVSNQAAQWRSSTQATANDLQAAVQATSELQSMLSENTQLLTRVMEHQRQWSQDYANTNIAEQMRLLQHQIGRLADRIGPSDGDSTIEPVSAEHRTSLLGRLWGRKA